ncbi:MAG: UDP-3-O-(3-hydroxymyristoyl)glucosamine N-acyltransferase [Thermodesulfobacteriaceae bacterium]|nr:UDP-3-O-(3-hydroxymyristoyl)glucosamine N-acyltransferase [Thermodesulfobacteriaceae bacterium]
MRSFKLSEIKKIVDGKLIGEDLEIKGINAISLAKEDELIFVDSPRRVEQAKLSKAKAVMCEEGLSSYFSEKSVLVVKNVRVAVAKVSALFKKEPEIRWEISEHAIIEEEVEIETPCAIYPWVYIQKGVKIKKGVILYPGVFVGAYSEIGENTIVYPRVVIYPYTKIGKNCILHAGAVIGADGFGFAQEPTPEGYRNLKIYHFGGVEIEDEVEIGANTTIDRAVFGKTMIKEGTKIDNLVQIGHNAQIGRQNILVAQVGISGSVVLEDYVMLAGQVGVAPSIRIGKGAKVAAKSGVAKDVSPGEEVAGIPTIKASTWRRSVLIFEKLPELYKKLKTKEGG